MFLLERENQFVWESIGQIKLFEIKKEADKTNGQILQTITKKLTWLHIMKMIFIISENLTVIFHIFFVLNIHVKFHSNRILFTIKSINLFFMHNLVL